MKWEIRNVDDQLSKEIFIIHKLWQLRSQNLIILEYAPKWHAVKGFVYFKKCIINSDFDLMEELFHSVERALLKCSTIEPKEKKMNRIKELMQLYVGHRFERVTSRHLLVIFATCHIIKNMNKTTGSRFKKSLKILQTTVRSNCIASWL